jgi:hypothetical protein
MNVSPSLLSSRDPADSDNSTSGSVHPLKSESESELKLKLKLKETSHWLLDGYNVLHAALLPGELRSQTPWWNEDGRQRLIRRVFFFDALKDPRKDVLTDDIQGESGQPHDRTLKDATTPSSPIIWIVFDGERPAPESDDQHPRVRVIFAPSADDYLVSRSRRAEPDQSIFVVSSDKRVIGRCAHAGAQIVKPRDFLARCIDSKME